MAQAAPASKTTKSGGRRPGAAALARSPFARLAVVLAVVYGLWTAEIGRDAGPITGYNVLLGVVAGILFGVCFLGLHLVGHRLQRELRAMAWAAFTGVSFGFMYSLSGASVLRSTGMALGVAALAFAATFYRYYSTER
ncbi:hypothetical protein [Streptomyces cavernae]|uniref:hypothetical protein n=1 Tax=Streptomyces cavernae TaxID=2259034 RepID=UPI001EE4460E|nr:hypothetical protein [Streptomyces cavernae]